ncbi:hypothetical protein FCL40_10705 [Ferrimonas sediminicola]|uniref:Uncharacterized protein n=1 Tax=Ferrimonas sediminicola TaxID=2569538 RepID=A0A4U1BC72_9GAMM|nr:hypothetical protein [Ferrimonas sediminicola]TKB48623.1 hypothetical protein FCL40_10705 [Ferrimonas sediminicola]
MSRTVFGFLLLCLAGCSGLNTTFNKPYAPLDEVQASPPPPLPPPPPLKADQARVERVLGMERDRLWLTLSSRPVGIAPQVLLAPREVMLPSVSAGCPLERNLARALVVYLNEQLAGQVMQLEGMAVTETGVVAEVILDGQPLLQRLEAEGLARPLGSFGWCPPGH